MTVQRLDLDGRGHRPLPEDRTALVVAAVLLAILLGGRSAADLCTPGWLQLDAARERAARDAPMTPAELDRFLAAAHDRVRARRLDRLRPPARPQEGHRP